MKNFSVLQPQLFYLLKPVIPRSFQLFLRRLIILWKHPRYRNIWPIDEEAAKIPDKWSGWPQKKKFALVLTHDVETAIGQKRSLQLMELEKEMGFRSSFNFVPERYKVSDTIRNELTISGFEVGVHGLKHDGKLYSSRKIFRERSNKINQYLEDWKAVGFRSPSMHHRLDWIEELSIEYDASTFDTDPFEPHPDGVRTIFPFHVKPTSGKKGYVELPYTLPQDFTLFVLLKKKIEIWKQKLDWIAANGGMALVLTHPDYMTFNHEKPKAGNYPVEYYIKFLEYINNEYKGQYWHVLPKQIARFWSSSDCTA